MKCLNIFLIIFCYFTIDGLSCRLESVVADFYTLNRITSFSQIKEDGIRAIIHKSTEGLTWNDKSYKKRKSESEAAGLLWGAYHFARNNDGEEEAKKFLSFTFPGWKPCTPDSNGQDSTGFESIDTCYEAKFPLLVLDVQESSNTISLINAEKFVNTIKKYVKIPPVLYGGYYLKVLTRSLSSSPLFECPLWLSHFSNVPVLPNGWCNFTLWQYTDGNVGPEPRTIQGVVGPSDRSYFNNFILTEGLPPTTKVQGRTITQPHMDTSFLLDGLQAFWDLYSPVVSISSRPKNMDELDFRDLEQTSLYEADAQPS